MWQKDAAEFSFTEAMVVAIKDARVDVFKDVIKLLAGAPAVVTFNPNSTDVQQLKTWHSEEGHEDIPLHISGLVGNGN